MPAIWYSADAPAGLRKIKPENFVNIHDSKPLDKPANVVSVLESYLPPDLCYKDKDTEILNGKFQNNKIKINNEELHKYIYQMYGPDVVADLMHNVTILSYDICKDFGITLGFDIKIFGGDKVKASINEIKEETYNQMCAMELTNDPLKDFKIVQESELQKPRILEYLIPNAKGTNIDDLGFLQKFQDEYYQNVIVVNHVRVDGRTI